MTAYCGPIFNALGKRAILIEMVRHPLYMVIQATKNFSGLIGTARHFSICYDYQGKNNPFGFEMGFIDRNSGGNFIKRTF